MVHYKETDVTIKRRVGKFAGAVVVDDPCYFFGKGAKAKDVGDGVVVYIINEVETQSVGDVFVGIIICTLVEAGQQ